MRNSLEPAFGNFNGFPPDCRLSINFDRFCHFQSVSVNFNQFESISINFKQFGSIKNAGIYCQPEVGKTTHNNKARLVQGPNFWISP